MLAGGFTDRLLAENQPLVDSKGGDQMQRRPAATAIWLRREVLSSSATRSGWSGQHVRSAKDKRSLKTRRNRAGFDTASLETLLNPLSR